MLQISTGMYFRDVELYETVHTAEFFTNASVADTEPIEMPFGTLTFAPPAEDGIATVTVAVVDRLEAVDQDGKGSWLVATGGIQLLDEAATVVAFAANVTVSRYRAVVERTVTEPDRRAAVAPSSILARTFDPSVELSDGDFDDLRSFCSTLLTLNRREYDAAMRAMRKTVDASLMVADDPGLAYTLFVSTLESLAQVSPVSERDLSWDRYDPGKRKILDPVLDRLPASDADEVRLAILDADQHQLVRRFKVFAAAHVTRSFYRSEAEGARSPLRAHDLDNALSVAYGFRSRNIHSLADLNAKLWVQADRADTLRWEGRWVFGLQGLNRLCRHVLREFVARSPTGVDPDFDYRLHLDGAIYGIEFVPEMWLGHVADLTAENARRELDGLVSVLLEVRAGRDPATVPINMDPVLDQIEAKLPGLAKTEQRLAMVAIYVLWRAFTPERERPRAEEILENYRPDLDAPGIVAFAVDAVLGYIPDWPADAWADLAAERSRDLVRGKGQPMPPSIDTALLLCASLHNGAVPGLAADLMSQAVESHPGYERLVWLEQLATDEKVHDVSVDVIGYLRDDPDWVEVSAPGDGPSPPEADHDGGGPVA